MNYLDWQHARLPASYMYNELEKKNIPVMIMEPLLGGDCERSRNVMEMMAGAAERYPRVGRFVS